MMLCSFSTTHYSILTKKLYSHDGWLLACKPDKEASILWLLLSQKQEPSKCCEFLPFPQHTVQKDVDSEIVSY